MKKSTKEKNLNKKSEEIEEVSNSIEKEQAIRSLVKCTKSKSSDCLIHSKKKLHKDLSLVFSIEEVEKVISESEDIISKNDKQSINFSEAKIIPIKKEIISDTILETNKKWGAASLSDILGFDPRKQNSGVRFTSNKREVKEKYKKYYNMLLDLKEKVENGLTLHKEETLKETSSDLAKLSMDTGSENYNKDVMLGMVSSEKETLDEINAAIDRIYDDCYGVCEITSEPISNDRLTAIPYTRYSKEGQLQSEQEKKSKTKQQAIGVSIFSDDVTLEGDSEDGFESTSRKSGSYDEDEDDF